MVGHPRDHARHVLLVTQAVLCVSVVVCLVINHSAQAQNDGISFYGVNADTWPVLTAGFLVGTVGLWRTARYLDATDASSVVHYGVRWVALALPLLLLTPYNRGAVLNWAHMTIGVTMALAEFAVSIDLLLRHRRRWIRVGFFIQLVGGLIGAAAMPDWHFGYLLQGEILIEVGFGWCLLELTYAVGAKRARARDTTSA